MICEDKSVVAMIDGKPVEIKLKDIHAELRHYTEVFALGKTRGKERFKICEIELTTPKRFRCKNRKRFIKLLMASGVNRNTAQETANYVVWTNRKDVPTRFELSYQRYYDELWYCCGIRL